MASALIAALAALGASGPVARAAIPQKAIWGPTTLPAGSAICPDTGPCSAFPVYRELGVDVFQFQIHWDEVAPQRPRHPRNPDDPAYRWDAVDAVVEAATANRVGLAAQVAQTPGWANGGRDQRWAPNHPGAYADFLAAASRRYPRIRRWMVWGEPSRAENFQPLRRGDRRGPRVYARLLDRAYAELKKVSPRNTVIGAMTFSAGAVPPPRFIEWMKLPNGRPPRMDLWGHNPYDGRYPRLSGEPEGSFRGFNDIDTLHSEIAEAYPAADRRSPGLWLSEWTVSDTATDIFAGFHASRREQSVRLRAAYTIARRTGYVAAFGWFTLIDQPASEGGAGWGLLDAEGNPKPVFATYRSIR